MVEIIQNFCLVKAFYKNRTPNSDLNPRNKISKKKTLREIRTNNDQQWVRESIAGFNLTKDRETYRPGGCLGKIRTRGALFQSRIKQWANWAVAPRLDMMTFFFWSSLGFGRKIGHLRACDLFFALHLILDFTLICPGLRDLLIRPCPVQC